MRNVSIRENRLGKEIEELAKKMKDSMEKQIHLQRERDEAVNEVTLHRRQSVILEEELLKHKSMAENLHIKVRETESLHHATTLELQSHKSKLNQHRESLKEINQKHDNSSSVRDEYETKFRDATDQLAREALKSKRLEEEVQQLEDEKGKLLEK